MLRDEVLVERGQIQSALAPLLYSPADDLGHPLGARDLSTAPIRSRLCPPLASVPDRLLVL
jgi:hypothetical protein